MDFNWNAYRLERTQLDVFASLVWIVIMQEPGFQNDLRLCRLTKLFLYEDFAAGANRLEVH